MALNFLLSKELKDSSAYDSLENLLEHEDFSLLRNIYCAKETYSKFVQGEVIDYVTDFPESRDMYARVKTFNNKVIECRIYNHNNNVKIRRRDYSHNPVKEDDHIYSFDYKTGRSSVSSIYRDVYINNDKEYAKVTKYQKAIFEWDGSLYDFEDEVKTFDNNKTRKY